jgi:hypothetical protein
VSWLHLWKNVEGYQYLQYCDALTQLHPKLVALLQKHGKTFDERYEFELRHTPTPIVVRRPVVDQKDAQQ